MSESIPETQNLKQSVEALNAEKALRIASIATVTSLVTAGFYYFLAWQLQNWSAGAMAGVITAYSVIAWWVMGLIRKGRVQQGGWIMLVGLWGMFIFAVGNGLCEAVVNPLTATLFATNKTHYLNILHAGWPAGLVLGSVASALMAAKTDESGNLIRAAVDWKIQMSLFLIPVLTYGVMLFGQKFPKSEAADAGVSTGSMVATLFAPLMLCLLAIHAMVGYVELGTDSWIAKITGSIMASPTKGLVLFSYTSLLMFGLRFFAGPIVHRTSPLGLLFGSAVLGATGLTLLGSASTVTTCRIFN